MFKAPAFGLVTTIDSDLLSLGRLPTSVLAMLGYQAVKRSFGNHPRATGRPRYASSEHAQTSFDNDEYELLEEGYDSDDYEEVGSRGSCCTHCVASVYK
jgi:hypothetical protein